MAITKILYRNGGLRQAIDYITNPVKTAENLLSLKKYAPFSCWKVLNSAFVPWYTTFGVPSAFTTLLALSG